MPIGSFAIRECDRYRATTDAIRTSVAIRELSFAFNAGPATEDVRAEKYRGEVPERMRSQWKRDQTPGTRLRPETSVSDLESSFSHLNLSGVSQLCLSALTSSVEERAAG